MTTGWKDREMYQQNALAAQNRRLCYQNKMSSFQRWVFFFQSVQILSMTSFGREVKPWVPCLDFRHVKESQAEIRASEQNLSDFSRSMSEATLMTYDVKSVVKLNNNNQ